MIGDKSPTTPGCPGVWVAVGEAYGTNNAAGTGVEAGSPDMNIRVKTGSVSVTAVNFGMQRAPNADNYIRSITQPKKNDLITLNGQGLNPPVLTGIDAEDCPSGCQLTNKSVIIDSIPVNAELYYNNQLVINNQKITTFNPSLLQIKFTAATGGDISVHFRYSYVDAANTKALSSANYELLWLLPLPATGLTTTVTQHNEIATVKWLTLSEQNTDYFVVERSLDNKTFTATGNTVAAAGNSVDQRNYELNDNLAGLPQGAVVYYRVKLIDIDRKVSYGNVVLIKLTGKTTNASSVWPNPFQSSITISLTSQVDTKLDIKLMDINGKVVRRVSQVVSRGSTQVAVKDLSNLTPGTYLVELRDQQGNSSVHKIIKSN